MHDIPYSDFFCVNVLFQVDPIEDQEECDLKISVACHFTKQTIFHDKIAEATISRTTESFTNWINLALQHIQFKSHSHPSHPTSQSKQTVGFHEEESETHNSHNNVASKQSYIPPSKKGHFLENMTQHYGIFLTFPGTVFVLFIAFLVFFVLKIESLSDRVEELERIVNTLKK